MQTAIPEGFVVPLVYGLKSLLKVDENGIITWRINPDSLLESKFTSIVGDFKMALQMLDNDPQKVGKSPEPYRLAEMAFERALPRP